MNSCRHGSTCTWVMADDHTANSAASMLRYRLHAVLHVCHNTIFCDPQNQRRAKTATRFTQFA